MESACSVACAILFAKTPKGADHRMKAIRKETRAMLEKIKTKAQWAKEAQTAFNKFIRLRDSGRPCISCDKPDNGSHQRHASHLRSVGACGALRFDELNVHASCATCNSVKSGNLLEYRIRLVVKLSQQQVDWLEGPHEAKRYRIEDYKEIKAHYNKLCKEMNNAR